MSSSNTWQLSHLKRWIFPSRTALDRHRQKCFDQSVSDYLQQNYTQSDKAPPCPLTVEKQKGCLRWFVRALLDIAKAKKFQHRVADTTLAFFARFYLKQSMARYPPQMVLFCCIIIAIKAENLSDYVTAFQLFGDVGQVFKLSDALKLEPVLLDVLGFDILILHGEGPLTLMNNEYYHWRRRRRALQCPQTFQPSAEGHGEPFVQFLSAMQERCESLYLELYSTDLHFLCTPAEVAVGIFLYVTKTVFGLTDVDEFLLSLQPEAIRTDPKQSQTFLEKAATIAHLIFEFQEQEKIYDVAFWGPAVSETMKEVRRWTKLVQGASKRKRANDKGTSLSKKPKLDETPTPDL